MKADERWQLIHGDCLEELKKLPANSVDAVVCDPPYGLSEPPNAWAVIERWLSKEKYEHKKAGFMSNDWDSFVPGPEYWFEVERVMKPGAHALIFAGTRTWDWMSLAARMAGLELRDTVMWIYGSGFPKSLDISKAIDKAVHAKRERVGTHPAPAKSIYSQGEVEMPAEVALTAPATPAARQWSGWGTALKPAWEPVLLFQKPVAHEHIAGNVVKWGTGGLNIDGCRIGSDGGTARASQEKTKTVTGWTTGHEVTELDKGRWPANLVLAHNPECKQLSAGRRTAGSKVGHQDAYVGGKAKKEVQRLKYEGEEPGRWECAEGCAVRMLDEQSGTLKTGNGPSRRGGLGYQGGAGGENASPRQANEGGASRFFYSAKVSASERDAGQGGCDISYVLNSDAPEWAAKEVLKIVG